MLNKLKATQIFYYVKDLTVSVKFYGDVLGLREVWRCDYYKLVAFDAEGIALVIIENAEKVTPGRDPHLFFAVADIETAYQDLLNQGVKFTTSIETCPPGKVAEFEDPEGHVHYLFQPTKAQSS